MTVHFFYNFKDELIHKIKEEYEDELQKRKEELRKQKQLDEAEEKVLEYFKVIKNGLSEVMEVANDKIKYEENNDFILKFSIGKNSIKFTRNASNIEAQVGLYLEESDMIESKILGHVVPGEKTCTVKEVGKLHTGSHFDENTINHYMRVAFGSYLYE